MQNTIHLDPNQVPATIRGGYTGKQFQVQVAEQVTVPFDAGLWDGGSREIYSAVRIADGVNVPFDGQAAAPWDATRRDRTVALKPGIAVICHRMFRGKDMGLRIYVCAADAAPMLPAPVELTAVEKLVLEYTSTRKSSYMGKDRFQMAVEDLRHGYRSRDGIERLDRAIWDAAKAALISRGLLNKAGAITTAGRNAISA